VNLKIVLLKKYLKKVKKERETNAISFVILKRSLTLNCIYIQIVQITKNELLL